MTDLPGRHPTAGRYPHELEETHMTTPNVPAPAAQPAPEPLVKAEMVRALIAAVVAAGWIAPIPDPVLGVVIPIAVTVLGALISAGLTLVARGKVWAIRHGVDVDQVVDELQRRSGTTREGQVR